MKPEEAAFQAKCREYRKQGKTIRDCVNDTPEIPFKRKIYWIEKWSDKGIYNYGVCLDLGWFEDEKMDLSNARTGLLDAVNATVDYLLRKEQK